MEILQPGLACLVFMEAVLAFHPETGSFRGYLIRHRSTLYSASDLQLH